MLEKIHLSGEYNLSAALDVVQSRMTEIAECGLSRIQEVKLGCEEEWMVCTVDDEMSLLGMVREGLNINLLVCHCSSPHS
jgi:hypothetical protein